MKLLTRILSVVCIVVAAAMSSCSDDLLLVDPDTPGAVTITMRSGSMEAAATRANDGDPEFYIGETYFYFYPTSDRDTECVYCVKTNINSYTTGSYTKVLGDEVISKLFSESNVCYVYIVSNPQSDLPTSGKETSINKLKQTPVQNDDFDKYKDDDGNYVQTSFPMDGIGKVTYDSDTKTMSGSITLARAAAKIILGLRIKGRVWIDANTYYEPLINLADSLSELDESVIDETLKSMLSSTTTTTVKLHNNATKGLLDGEAEELGIPETPYTRDYRLSFKIGTTAEKTTRYYTHDAFYLYPSSWTEYSGKDVYATLAIPWLKVITDASNQPCSYSYETFYYQVPIRYNDVSQAIERNVFYNISLEVSTLGGTLEGEVVTPDPSQISYEIADWTEDNTNISATLDRNHYLVVEDNNFELYAQSDLTFEYQSCSDITAYLTEVKYVSTKYLENGTGETIYLYKAKYTGKEDLMYEEDTSAYIGHSPEVREARKDDVLNHLFSRYDIESPVTSFSTGKLLTLTQTESTSSGAVNGKVTFYSVVTETANKIYRPLIYTIVLVNGSDHPAARQTITITQYPSKYVEFGAAGNVFVNGYYARLIPDTGFYKSDLPAGSIKDKDTDNDIEYYASFPFIWEKTDSAKQTGPNGVYQGLEDNDGNYSGYYRYPSRKSYYTNVYYKEVDSTSIKTSINLYHAINTSNEYLCGIIPSTLGQLTYTIDVKVSAFSESDYSFEVYEGNGTTPQEVSHKFRIGDPRQKKSYYMRDRHDAEKYMLNDSTGLKQLYDYYVFGDSVLSNIEATPWYYDRYVKSWGDLAGKIKVGGYSPSYDDIISPYYKVQSNYGALLSKNFFYSAQRRCATYQEAGYPAGRWRLPTLAEIAFIVRLQLSGAIDKFIIDEDNNAGYWTCSGSCIVLNGDSLTYYKNAEGYQTGQVLGIARYCRCVYDLWYWGTEPEKPTHKYYPKPTK